MNLPSTPSTLTWSHLSEKRLVDLVNGIDVAQEKLRFRASRGDWSSRILDTLTGRGREEVQQLMSLMATGQAAILDWLKFLQNNQVNGDLAMTRIARHVLKLQDVIESRMDMLERDQTLLARQQLAQQFRMERMHVLHFSESDATIELVRVQLEAKLSQATPLVKLFYVVDSLWWGKAGQYVRNAPPERRETAENLRKAMYNAVLDVAHTSFSQALGTRDDLLIDVADLLAHVRRADVQDLANVVYAAGQPPAQNAPLHFILGSAAGVPVLPNSMPTRMTWSRLAQRLWMEAEAVSTHRTKGGENDHESA